MHLQQSLEQGICTSPAEQLAGPAMTDTDIWHVYSRSDGRLCATIILPCYLTAPQRLTAAGVDGAGGVCKQQQHISHHILCT